MDEKLKTAVRMPEFQRIFILSRMFPNKLGGGNLHLEFLRANIKRRYNVEIFESLPRVNRTQSLTFIRKLIVHLLGFTSGILDLEAKDTDLLLVSTPYPKDLLPAIVYRIQSQMPWVLYLHHWTPSFIYHPIKRGVIRVIYLSVYFYVFFLIVVLVMRIPLIVGYIPRSSLLSRQSMQHFDVIPKSFRNALDSYANVMNKYRFHLAYIGGMSRHKGTFDFLFLINQLKRNNPEIKGYIGGFSTDKTMKKIKRMLQKLNLTENVTVAGFITEEEKVEILSASMVFAHLSYEEGRSLGVMEAAYAAKPLLLYELPAYWYLQGNYFSAKPGKITDLVSKCHFIFEHYDIALNLAKAAKKCVELFNDDYVIDNEIQILETAFKSTKRE